MKAYRFPAKETRRIPVRWHDRGWALTLDASPAGSGREQRPEENMDVKPTLRARFPIAMGRMISQPSRDARHRR